MEVSMALSRSAPLFALLALTASAAAAQPSPGVSPATYTPGAYVPSAGDSTMMAFQYDAGRRAPPGEDIYQRAAHRARFAGAGTALPLYREAAAAGSPSAMRELGFLYVSGNAVPRDLTRGLEFLYEAARRDDPAAMLALASAFGRGEGVARDERLARFWLVRAADAGYRPAMAARRRLATH
jgi:TPR repeat protein